MHISHLLDHEWCVIQPLFAFLFLYSLLLGWINFIQMVLYLLLSKLKIYLLMNIVLEIYWIVSGYSDYFPPPSLSDCWELESQKRGVLGACDPPPLSLSIETCCTCRSPSPNITVAWGVNKHTENWYVLSLVPWWRDKTLLVHCCHTQMVCTHRGFTVQTKRII